jgi:coproporphyrinogen III oxidase-like Fe-S oxidoreductase
VAGSETLSKAEAQVEALHLGLRTSSAADGGVLREGFYDLFGLYPEDALTRDSLFTDGLLAHREGRILLTERGLLLSDEVY